MLPALWIKAVILAVVAGVIAFCGQKISAGKNREPVLIGYTAAEDRMTEMAVSFVENMESVKNWCELVSVTETEGMDRLKDGSLAALIVLPDDVMQGILDGSNRPATLYIAGEQSASGMIFEELARAGVGMLCTAQAEIYAAGDLVREYGGAEQDAQLQAYAVDLDELYRQIDSYNLSIVLKREQYFKERTLSATGNEGTAVYFGSVLCTLYLLTAGLFLIPYLSRKQEEQLWFSGRLGISAAVQCAGKSLIAFLLWTTQLVPLFLLWIFFRNKLPVSWAGFGGIGEVLTGGLFLILWVQLATMWSEKRRVALMCAGLLAIVSAYFAGCFVPPALMPKAAESLSAFLPGTLIRNGFVRLFSGRASSSSILWKNLICGVLAGGLYVAFCTLRLHALRGGRGGKAGCGSVSEREGRHGCEAGKADCEDTDYGYVSCGLEQGGEPEKVNHRAADSGYERCGLAQGGAPGKASHGAVDYVQGSCGSEQDGAPEKSNHTDVDSAYASCEHAGEVPPPNRALELLVISLKRMLCKKTFVVCLAITLLLSVVAVRIEKNSDTRIDAAVFTQDESLRELFAAYEGLVHFIICEDESEVTRHVMRGDVECGYILEEGLLEQIGQGKGNWTITAYHGSDSVLSAVVNEVLFERIFYAISGNWFETFMKGQAGMNGEAAIGTAARDALERRRTDGSTFNFALLRVGEKEQETTQGYFAYPIWGVSIGCIAFCGAIGISQAVEDRKHFRFPKRNRLCMAALTVGVYLLGGILTALFLLVITGTLGG